MRTNGVKILDPVLESKQLDWMVVRVEECPNEQAERQLVARHFRLPRQPAGNLRAYVEPVVVRRSRRRVLFQQASGEVF
ncbi:MAG: hypothetical protein HUU20_03040 [Pirellulales bacterium]|nr:hypothetical protein [Pirellulales bacterium]